MAKTKQEEVVVTSKNPVVEEVAQNNEQVSENATEQVAEFTGEVQDPIALTPEKPIAPAAKADKAVVVSEEKTRRVLGLKDHDCKIGFTRIFIQKGKETNVSVNAAHLLSKQGIVVIR